MTGSIRFEGSFIETAGNKRVSHKFGILKNHIYFVGKVGYQNPEEWIVGCKAAVNRPAVETG